jgi:hypothetical protein
MTNKTRTRWPLSAGEQLAAIRRCDVMFSYSTAHNDRTLHVLESRTVNKQDKPMAFQWKALRMIVDAPRYVPNTVIRRDLQTPTVTEEIRCYSSQYSARLSAHPNDLMVNLMELLDNRRLRRHLPNDLPTRFLV